MVKRKNRTGAFGTENSSRFLMEEIGTLKFKCTVYRLHVHSFCVFVCVDCQAGKLQQMMMMNMMMNMMMKLLR